MKTLEEIRQDIKIENPNIPNKRLELLAKEAYEKIKTLQEINNELEKRGCSFKVINYSGGIPFDPDLKSRSRKYKNTIIFVADETQKVLDDPIYAKKQEEKFLKSLKYSLS